MPSFDIHPLNQFAGGSTAINRPREIACFSFDENHEYRPDDSSLQYYYTPDPDVDLCKGFDSFRELNKAQDDHLDALLKTILEKERKDGKKTEADFVTWRGMMTNFMTAPFDRFSNFEMYATSYQENWTFRSSERVRQTAQPVSRITGHTQAMMAFWGYKFETLCLIPDIWANVSRDYIEGREAAQVSNFAQYISVASTKIGTSSLVLGGEVDCIWDSKHDDPSRPLNWVELKCQQIPASEDDKVKFERKLCKIWAQSFLLGVPKIIIGFRTRQGILKYTQEFATQRIPGDVNKGPYKTWNGNVCINFTAAILEWLKATIPRDGTVVKIVKPKNTSTIHIQEAHGKQQSDILSAEFMAWRQEMAEKQMEEVKEIAELLK
ncbi:RAI1-domain-containing protein [Aulographum hederae CBS 113979]|uniref:Decapping nuclease n=1 Tax=Aulographum hederae CBS 113979 TaxID=1176131 RepID=A0A6G1GZ17_9PEZI|nr:RAI1-domain-containing protein [Aulographum hederae CBS 113979]